MKKVILLSIVMLSLLLILTGCDEQETQTTGVGAYIGGTQGIVADFEPFGVEEDGVYSIFDSETFPIEVTLRNKGEYQLKENDVKIELIGIAHEELSGIPNWILKNDLTIDKVSEFVPEGGELTMTFSSNVGYENEVTGAIERFLFANVEYNYQTYVIIPQLCLKEDVTDDRVCEVKEAKDFFVSGAPITIKSVEETTSGRGIVAFKILVSNVGTGKVAKLSEEFGVYDKLSYNLDDPAWECQSGGKVNEARLVNGQAEIICKLKEPLAAGTISTKQVKLTFDYKYRDVIQETLRIKESS